jgi:hypothetical protein
MAEVALMDCWEKREGGWKGKEKERGDMGK